MILEILGIILASLLSLWVYNNQKRPYGFPPGPRGIPIMGYLPFMGREPHKKLGELGKKYGDIFSVYYGNYPIVVLNSLPVIRSAFRQDVFSGRPNHLLAMEVSKDGITFNAGQVGYEQRRFTLKTLRDLGFGKESMEKLVEEEVQELIEYFQKRVGQPIEIKYLFGLFVINALWRILAGDKFRVDDPKIQELYRICIEGFIDPPVAGSLWFMPWLAKLMPESSGYNSVVRAITEARVMFRQVVDQHKESWEPGVYRDFIDVYLEKIKKTEDPNSSFYGAEGEKQLVHVLIDLFSAGSDTLNSSIGFAILYLANNRHIQERVQQEIDTVVGRCRLPTTDDRKLMPYTEAVICETFRLSSIVVGAILHDTTEDTKLGPYFLPKGTIVMANLYNVHHDPEVWKDPESFNPERFLKENEAGETIFVKNENLVPFSVGKRVCIAEIMAQTEFFIFLAGLLQHFDFTFPPDEMPGMNYVDPGLVLSPKKFNIVVTERE